MTYTSKQAFAGRKAAERLSPAAYAYHKTLKPFFLYEYETPDGIRYAYTGIIGDRDKLPKTDITPDMIQCITHGKRTLYQKPAA